MSAAISVLVWVLGWTFITFAKATKVCPPTQLLPVLSSEENILNAAPPIFGCSAWTQHFA